MQGRHVQSDPNEVYVPTDQEYIEMVSGGGAGPMGQGIGSMAFGVSALLMFTPAGNAMFNKAFSGLTKAVPWVARQGSQFVQGPVKRGGLWTSRKVVEPYLRFQWNAAKQMGPQGMRAGKFVGRTSAQASRAFVNTRGGGWLRDQAVSTGRKLNPMGPFGGKLLSPSGMIGMGAILGVGALALGSVLGGDEDRMFNSGMVMPQGSEGIPTVPYMRDMMFAAGTPYGQPNSFDPGAYAELAQASMMGGNYFPG